jgi:hypothetical protein
MSMKNVGVVKTARKKPMSQSWPLLLSEEEDVEGEKETASEDEVRRSHNSITKILLADVWLKGVTTGQIARKKPMSQPLPLLSDEEDGGGEVESASEDEVRPGH